MATGRDESPGLAAVGKLAGPLAIALSAVAMTIWSWRSWPDPLIDFGQQLYVPWRLAEGDALYRDVAYHYGPLSPWIHGLLFRLFGPGLIVVALANLTVLAGILAVLYRLLVGISGRLAATLAGLTFVGVFAFGQLVPYGNYNFVCPYANNVTHGIALSLLGIYGLDVWRRRGGLLPLAGIGLILGLLFLTKAEIFLAGSMAIVVGFVLLLPGVAPDLTRRRRAAATLIGCALAPPLLAFALLAAAMPLDIALRGVVGTWSVILGGEIGGGAFYRWSFGLDDPLGRLARIATSLFGYGLVLAPTALLGLWMKRPGRQRQGAALVLFVATVAFLRTSTIWWPDTIAALPLVMLGLGLVVALRLWPRRSVAEPGRSVLTLTMILFATLLLARILMNARTYHYGFALAMPATLLAVVALFDWVPAAIERAGGYGGLLRAVGFALWGAFLLGHLSVTRDYFELKTEVVASGRDAFRSGERGSHVNAMLAEIERSVDPQRTLAVLPTGVLLSYLARRESSTPFIYFMPSDLPMYGGRRVVDGFRSNPPDFVLLVHKDTTEFGARFFGRDYGRELYGWIREHYLRESLLGAPPLAGDRFGMELLRRRDGEAALQGEPPDSSMN